jgi:hypothetical protein
MGSRTCPEPRSSSSRRCDEVSGPRCPVSMIAGIRSACAIALDLQYMFEHLDIGENHNAAVFSLVLSADERVDPEAGRCGLWPRVMLEYPGTLLHGLRRTGADNVLAALRTITVDGRHLGAVSGWDVRWDISWRRRRRCRTSCASTGQRCGCTAATSTSTSPLSTSSRRPASSPDVPDRPTDIERRTAHGPKAREGKLKAREGNLARTQRHGEARPRHDRPARLRDLSDRAHRRHGLRLAQGRTRAHAAASPTPHPSPVVAAAPRRELPCFSAARRPRGRTTCPARALPLVTRQHQERQLSARRWSGASSAR